MNTRKHRLRTVGIEFLEPCKNVLIFQRFAHEQESPSDFLAANAVYA
jgi:hypothetical protein